MLAVDSFDEYPHFFEVKLELFDGPIDLLLHLVKEQELPIEKVSLAEVSSQYLECLETMRRFDLEVAGEYLVIAATLLSIKSSILLSDPVQFVEDEHGNLVDPHEELLRRLREAQVYKKGAQQLGSRGFLGIDVFSSPSLLKHFKAEPTPYKDHDPMLLGQAFKALLDQAGSEDESLYTVALESVSIIDQMMLVLGKLKEEQGPVVFYALIPDLQSRGSIIATFIALLELAKRQVIKVKQEKSSDDIMIALAVEDVDTSNFASEFDMPSAHFDAAEVANA